MIKLKSRILFFQLLATLSLQISYSQSTKNLVVITKNNVYGISASAEATMDKMNNISIITEITNKLSNGLSKLAYKIEFVGMNGKILKDTIINHVNSALVNPYPEYVYFITEKNGEEKIDTIANINYIDFFDSPEYQKSKYLITPGMKYSSAVTLKIAGVYTVRIKPLSATFGFISYRAPGY